MSLYYIYSMTEDGALFSIKEDTCRVNSNVNEPNVSLSSFSFQAAVKRLGLIEGTDRLRWKQLHRIEVGVTQSAVGLCLRLSLRAHATEPADAGHVSRCGCTKWGVRVCAQKPRSAE